MWISHHRAVKAHLHRPSRFVSPDCGHKQNEEATAKRQPAI